MRIGVHSGSLYSGLIGECKWQYDIWSTDVLIANHMEQSGEAGCVEWKMNQYLVLKNYVMSIDRPWHKIRNR